jgi:hypothetical protein
MIEKVKSQLLCSGRDVEWTLQLTRNSAQRTLLARTLLTMQKLEQVRSHAQSTAAEPPPALCKEGEDQLLCSGHDAG